MLMLLVLLFITCRMAKPGDFVSCYAACSPSQPVHSGMGVLVINQPNLHVHSLNRNSNTEVANES